MKRPAEAEVEDPVKKKARLDKSLHWWRASIQTETDRKAVEIFNESIFFKNRAGACERYIKRLQSLVKDSEERGESCGTLCKSFIDLLKKSIKERDAPPYDPWVHSSDSSDSSDDE